jgi:hypothetical protein
LRKDVHHKLFLRCLQRKAIVTQPHGGRSYPPLLTAKIDE